MQKKIIAPLSLLIAFGSGTAMASEDEGKTLFRHHGCITCHGDDAKDPASKIIPVLAGKPQDELFEKAKKILTGKGETKESKIMHAAFYSPEQCDMLPTDEELTAITVYIASVPKP